VIKMLRREFDAALPLCRESLALNTAKLGPTHPNTLSALSDLAACLAQLGQYQEALPLMEKAAQLWEEKLGRTHINTLLAFKHLADAHMHGNQLDKAAALFQFVWENRQNQPMFFICGVRLTNCYARLGNTADCVAAGKEVIAALRLQHPPGSRPLAESLEGITYHYLMAKAYTHAQTLQEEVLQIQEQTNRDSAGYFVTLALLARARAGTNDPAAEAILKTAYEGLVKYEKELAGNRRAELTKVADALITLYKSANKPEDVAKWEAELAKWKLPEKK
jgi:tetratricopeptide (TPR) repeat protein